MLFRSRDHSLVQQLYEQGEISYKEMRTSPQKNVILKAMQPHKNPRTEATLTHITDVEPGDYFFLCTDGMLEQMNDDDLVNILASSDSDEKKRKRLIEATANNKDNHSAYLIQVKDVTEEAKEPAYKSKPTHQRDSHPTTLLTVLLSIFTLLAGIAVGVLLFL